MIFSPQSRLGLPVLLVVLFVHSIKTANAQNDFPTRLSDAAIELTNEIVEYDARYFSIPYPNGDVPKGKGVCTDVVIRAYRKVGIDLQKEVHLDMISNFKSYPNKWNMKRCDTNIDHRRVPNLMTFFSRKGETLKISADRNDYKPGDIIAWDLGNGLTHIGIVVNKQSLTSSNLLIAHNIGLGQELSDCLFSFKIIGHYRFQQ